MRARRGGQRDGRGPRTGERDYVNTGDKLRATCAKCSKIVAHSDHEQPLPHNCLAHNARCSEGQHGEKTWGSLPKPTCEKCPPVTDAALRTTREALRLAREERRRLRRA